MEVTDTWVQGELAVNIFDNLCIRRKWPFVATPANRDFGKDGYVDVSDEGGTVTGESFFVQIKGGRSYASSGGYRIPVDDHLVAWRDSAAPVIGIVVDPQDERPRWVNLTLALREDSTLKSVFVDGSAVLDDPDETRRLRESVTQSTPLTYVPIGIGGISTREQGEAVWEAFALGHREAAPLVAVRRAFLSLDRGAAADAVYALSHCTPHPDIGWHDGNWLPPPVQNAVAASFRWSFHDVWRLLEFVDPEDGMGRGSIGQCVFMLLDADPNVVGTIERVIALTDDDHVADWAAAFAIHQARDGAREALERTLRLRPRLAESSMGAELIRHVGEFGFVNVMG
jgi:hypothetical protein